MKVSYNYYVKNQWLVLVVIIIAAVVFRFHNITSTPPGLYPDEAMNGNNALLAIETGDYKIFYPENNGREGLFINIQAQFLKLFRKFDAGYKCLTSRSFIKTTEPAPTGCYFTPESWMLRVPGAIFGVLTVLGLYLLVQRLFNWQIASLSSYLMAIAFWHVNFSRIGFRAIMAPMLLVWGMYFLWRGLSSGKLWNFAASAILWGLGFYTYIAFRAMPLSLILVLLAYWHATKKDFSQEKYLFTRNQLLRGLALFLIVFVVVALPIAYYFWTHPADFLGRTGQLSIFALNNPLQALAENTYKTLGMFNFIGDHNWRHNLSGSPILLWPVGVLFVLGFLRSWIKLFKRAKTHGHLSTVHVLLLSWFFIGLLPTVISNEGLPHALRAILVAPVVFIWAGEGLWWIIDKIGDFYRARDIHDLHIRHRWMKESSFVATIALLVFLAAITAAEYDKYFNTWAKNPITPSYFNQNYVKIGEALNMLPRKTKKYVLVNAGGVDVNGTPMPAQTVMFITDTWTPEKQKAKNIYYLTVEQFKKGSYDRNSVVVPLGK